MAKKRKMTKARRAAIMANLAKAQAARRNGKRLKRQTPPHLLELPLDGGLRTMREPRDNAWRDLAIAQHGTINRLVHMMAELFDIEMA